MTRITLFTEKKLKITQNFVKDTFIFPMANSYQMFKSFYDTMDLYFGAYSSSNELFYRSEITNTCMITDHGGLQNMKYNMPKSLRIHSKFQTGELNRKIGRLLLGLSTWY